MKGRCFSVILLSTNQCNAACDYCFEDKTSDRLSLERLRQICDKIIDHMVGERLGALNIHWQGGEAMLLPPDWYREAHRVFDKAASQHGIQVEHGLQTNLLLYTPKWNSVIAEVFGNTLSTSFDYPNLYRRIAGFEPEQYDALWVGKLEMARAAGIDVKVISVPNQATLQLGAEAFYEHLVGHLRINDFQINTPFPGGETNDTKAGLTLDPERLARFHCELAELWLERGADRGVYVGPFDQLLNYFMHREAILPCIWGENCTNDFIAIDADGRVAQCDCWVTSYPTYRYGNLLESDSLTELLRDSRVRRQFIDRPVRLMQGECIECDYLSLCHGGCPIRAYTANSDMFVKDPYCGMYKDLFAHMERRAAELCRQPTDMIADPTGATAE